MEQNTEKFDYQFLANTSEFMPSRVVLKIPYRDDYGVSGHALHGLDEETALRLFAELSLLLGKTPSAIARRFYQEADERAAANMLKTGVMTGAHYAAMQSIIKEWEAKEANQHGTESGA